MEPLLNKQESKAGILLKQRRLANQLDQKTLAKKAGTSPSQISRIERGTISPSIDTLEKLLNAMDEELDLGISKIAAVPATQTPSSSPSILYGANPLRSKK